MTERPDIVPIGQAFEDLAPGEMFVQVMADEVAQAHQWMSQNELYETVSAPVDAPRPGLEDLEETRAAIANG